MNQEFYGLHGAYFSECAILVSCGRSSNKFCQISDENSSCLGDFDEFLNKHTRICTGVCMAGCAGMFICMCNSVYSRNLQLQP